MSGKIKVEYGDKMYSGASTVELVLEMWEDTQLTKSEIADLIGRSRARVSKILTERGYIGHREYPELSNPAFFVDMTDIEIAERFDVAESRISSARRALNIRNVKGADMSKRRQEICEHLFGFDYQPGPEFTKWLYQQIQKLPENQAGLLFDFYVVGIRDVGGEARPYRYYVKNRLTETVTETVDDLIKKEVLVGNGNS